MFFTIHLLALALASARLRWRRVFVVGAGVCLVAVLASCGGGGGGGGGASVNRVPFSLSRSCLDYSTIPVIQACTYTETETARLMAIEREPEFTAQWGLNAINAQYAYERGATGAGVIVGVIDNGLDDSHSEFTGKVHPASRPTCTNPANPSFCARDHGTWTTSVVLAKRNRQGTHGVAYDAGVRFLAIPLGRASGELYEPFNPISMRQIAFRRRDDLRPFVEAGIPVVNMSFGNLGLVTDPQYSTTPNPVCLFDGADGCSVGNRIAPLRDLMVQTGTDAADRTIFVTSSGNSYGRACRRMSIYNCGSGNVVADVPHFFAGLAYHLPELRGFTLAVAAIQRDGTIASFSNRCGSLPATGWDPTRDGRHYCLVAPGVDIRVPNPSNFRSPDRTVDGTSFSAPHVAGAIAVLIDRFTDDKGTPETTDDERNVGNTAIVHRILDTADRTGTYLEDCAGSTITNDDGELECDTYSTIYGAGLLDLKAATEPVDPPVMMMGLALNGPALPLSQTRLFAGPAYGDAFARAFANTRVAAFDSMLFPFWHPLTSLVDSPPRRNIYYHRARFSPPSRIATHLPGVGTFHLGVKTLPPIPRRAFRRPDATDPARRRPSSLSFRRETASGSVFAAWRSPGSTPLSLRETLPTPLSSDAFTHPFMSLADNGISVGVRAGDLTAAAFTDPDAPSPVHGMALDYALLPYLSAQAGMVSEKGGALGLRPAGAFGGLSTTSTAFTGLKLDAPVSPRWRVLSHAHFGTARPDVSGIGLVKEVSPLLVSAVSVGIAGRGVLTDGDSLTLALSQPLRVERGRVSLVVPTGRTPDGDLRRVGIDAGLAPSGREVTLSAAWTAAVGRAAYVRLAAGASREPGHDASADDAFHALADVSFRF